jgi:CBS domain-containing protein
MLIRDVLQHKGSTVVTVGPEVMLLEAARILVDHNIGSAVVLEGGKVVGILTERDLLRRTAQDPVRLAETPVSEAMTSELEVVGPGGTVKEAMAVMTNRRIRHLPVMDQGDLVGLVSIGDLVNATINDLKDENRWLRDYVQGGG